MHVRQCMLVRALGTQAHPSTVSRLLCQKQCTPEHGDVQAMAQCSRLAQNSRVTWKNQLLMPACPDQTLH